MEPTKLIKELLEDQWDSTNTRDATPRFTIGDYDVMRTLPLVSVEHGTERVARRMMNGAQIRIGQIIIVTMANEDTRVEG